MRGDPGVLGHDAESIAVEHDTEDTSHGLGMTGRSSPIHLAGGVEAVVRTGALPERDCLGTDQLGVLVVERVGLEEHVRGGAELGEHHDMLEILRREPLLAALVEEGAHARQTIDMKGHLIRGIADEVGVGNGIGGAEIFAVAGIEAGEKVDRSRVARAGNGPGGVVGAVPGLKDHVVDGAHHKAVHANRHGLIDLVEQHGDERVELGGAGEGLLHLTLGDRAVDLEGSHLVKELGLGLGLMENVGVVGRTVRKLPRLVFNGHGHFGADFLHDRAVLPRIAQDRRSRALIRPDDEDHLADVIDEGLDVFVERRGVENRRADVDDVGQVLIEDDRVADGLLGGRVDELIDLRYFHDYFSFRLFSRLY